MPPPPTLQEGRLTMSHTVSGRPFFRNEMISMTKRPNHVVNLILQQQQYARKMRPLDTYIDTINCHVDEHGYAFLTQGKDLYIWQQESSSLHSTGTAVINGVKKLEVPTSVSGEPCLVKFVVRKVHRVARLSEHDDIDYDVDNDDDEVMTDASGFVQERGYHVRAVGLFAISREGHYRYWPDIIHNDGDYREADLGSLDGTEGPSSSSSATAYNQQQNQAPLHIAGISINVSNPSGQIYLWTADNYIYQINFHSNMIAPDNTLKAPIFTLLKRPIGMFSTLFKSLFATRNAHQRTAPSAKHNIRDLIEYYSGNKMIVLTEMGIECWNRNDDLSEWEFQYEWDLVPSFKKRLAEESDDHSEQKVWMLALTTSSQMESNMYLLAASCPNTFSASENPLVTYHVWGLTTGPTRDIVDLYVLPYQHDYIPSMEHELHKRSAIYATACNSSSLSLSPSLFILVRDQLIVLTDQNGDEYAHFDYTLRNAIGSGLLFGTLLSIISFEHGGVLVSRVSEEQYQQTMQSRSIAMRDSMALKGSTEQQRDEMKIQENRLLQQFSLFKQTRKVPQDTVLRNSKVASLASSTIVDSKPSSDWVNNTAIIQDQTSKPDETPVSLLVKQQLDRKKSNHDCFLDFLSAPIISAEPLWNEITDDRERYTILEHGEMIAVAIELRKSQNLPTWNLAVDPRVSSDAAAKASRLLLHSMIVCCEKRNLPKAQQSPENFFQQITQIGQFFDALVNLETDVLLEAQDDPLARAHIIWAVNSMFEALQTGVSTFRKHRTAHYNSLDDASRWTNRREFIVGLLGNRIHRTQTVLDDTADSNMQGELLRQIKSIADFQLQSFDELLSTFPDQNEINSQQQVDKANIIKDRNAARRSAIETLRNFDSVDFALTLAEKYRDFEQMILITEERGDITNEQKKQKLVQYAKDFRTLNFPYYLLKYLNSKGMYGRLLHDLGPEFSEEIGNFVNNTRLKWIHESQMDRFADASRTLSQMASDSYTQSIQQHSLSSSKTLYSLVKLASLASQAPSGHISMSPPETIKHADIHLSYIEAQETMAGIDPDLVEQWKMSPEELIERCCECVERKVEKSEAFKLDLMICAARIYAGIFEERGGQHNEPLLQMLWRAAWRASLDLCRADLTQPNDDMNERVVQQSCFYNLAVALPESPARLTTILRDHLMRELPDHEKSKLVSVFQAYKYYCETTHNGVFA